MAGYTVVFLAILGFSLAQSESLNNSKTKDVDGKSSNVKITTFNDQDNIYTLDAAMAECNDTFRTEMSYITALNESGSFPDETDRTPKCYVRCVLGKMGVASQDGQYDVAKTIMIFTGQEGDIAELEDMARNCSVRQELCKCERAYQYMKCISETVIKKQVTTS